MATGQLTIINLTGGGTFVFKRFPAEIGTEDSANWETVEVSGGTKPSFFANNEPQEISIDDVMIDNTDTNQSIEPEIEQLRDLMKPSGSAGAPPALQIMTAGFKQRVVLKSLSATRNFFTPAGVAIRASLRLQFTEIQAS